MRKLILVVMLSCVGLARVEAAVEVMPLDSIVNLAHALAIQAEGGQVVAVDSVRVTLRDGTKVVVGVSYDGQSMTLTQPGEGIQGLSLDGVNIFHSCQVDISHASGALQVTRITNRDSSGNMTRLEIADGTVTETMTQNGRMLVVEYPVAEAAGKTTLINVAAAGGWSKAVDAWEEETPTEAPDPGPGIAAIGNDEPVPGSDAVFEGHDTPPYQPEAEEEVVVDLEDEDIGDTFIEPVGALGNDEPVFANNELPTGGGGGIDLGSTLGQLGGTPTETGGTVSNTSP